MQCSTPSPGQKIYEEVIVITTYMVTTYSTLHLLALTVNKMSLYRWQYRKKLILFTNVCSKVLAC